MKTGDVAELKMQKVLCKGQQMDEKTYICEILKYDAQQECVVLILKTDKLTDISLDAVYKCEVSRDGVCTWCTGRVYKRYCSAKGKILRLQVENGFYKINIK